MGPFSVNIPWDDGWKAEGRGMDDMVSGFGHVHESPGLRGKPQSGQPKPPP